MKTLLTVVLGLMVATAAPVSAQEAGQGTISLNQVGDGWSFFEMDVLSPSPGDQVEKYGLFVSPTGEFSVVPNGDQPRLCPTVCPDPRFCECPGGGTPWGSTMPSNIDVFSFDFQAKEDGSIDLSTVGATIHRYELVSPIE